MTGGSGGVAGVVACGWGWGVGWGWGFGCGGIIGALLGDGVGGAGVALGGAAMPKLLPGK